ncbi:MAG: hypothetical protein FWG94_12300 [Oscillospiraceae bacterium]|nr:hypothetical protein [Oscillospiraceae bacterium]
MEKAFTRRTIAFFVVLTLILSMMVMPISIGGKSSPLLMYAAATTGNTGTIEGDSTVDSPTLNMVLPTSLNFELNPLELGSGNAPGNQIKTTSYVIANKTLAPVLVSFDIKATGKSDVTFLSSPSTLKQSDTTARDKHIFFGALGAKDVTSSPNFDGSAASPGFTYATEDPAPMAADVFVPFAPDENDDKVAEGSITFALGAATESAFAADDKGVAAFQFYAQLNTYAEWAASDVTVVGAWSLTALRTSDYGSIVTAEHGLNQLKGEAVEPEPEPEPEPDPDPENEVKFATGVTSASIEYTRGAKLNTVVSPDFHYRVFIEDKPAGVTSVTVNAASSTVYTAGTDYSYDSATGVLTMHRVGNSNATIAIVAGGTTYNLAFTVGT